MPRFVRELSENGKEILSMNEVVRYLIDSRVPVVADEEIAGLIQVGRAKEFQRDHIVGH